MQHVSLSWTQPNCLENWQDGLWALIIQEMDLSIKHKTGTKNRNADALSRSLVSNGDESNGDQANSADSYAHSSCVNAVNASECSDFYLYQIQKQCVSCRLRTRASTHFWPTSLLVIYLRMRSRRTVFVSKMFNVVDGVLHQLWRPILSQPELYGSFVTTGCPHSRSSPGSFWRTSSVAGVQSAETISMVAWHEKWHWSLV